MSNILDKAILQLIQTERFYAEMILLSKMVVTPECKTLDVSVTGDIQIRINPYFWNNHSTLEQVDFLRHECDHLLKGHPARWKDLEPALWNTIEETDGYIKSKEDSKKFTILNYSGDYENNESLKNLPKVINQFNKDGTKVLDPETGRPVEGRLLFVDDLINEDSSVLKNQNLEYYHDYLKKNPNKCPNEGSTLDDHTIWGESNTSKEFMMEKIKQLVNKAHENTIAAGERPSNDILKSINALNYKPRDWRAELQRFSAKLLEMERETSRKVRNRRYGLMYPGFRSFPKLTLALGIDTSGSMYEELLFQILAEVNKIHNLGVTVYVIQCDTVVHEVNKFDPKKEFSFKGRGGTCFAPILEAAAELDVDGLIIFSDMDNHDVDSVKKPKYSVLWASPEGCKPKYDWGQRTTITVNKK